MQYSKPISDQTRLAMFVNRALSRYCEVLGLQGTNQLEIAGNLEILVWKNRKILAR